MRNLLLFAALLGTFFSFGQSSKIQWASALEFEHNTSENYEYSGFNCIGPPDAFPPGRMNKNAVRLAEEAGYGTIKLSFQRPQHAQQIIIIENNLPGRVVRVQLIDEFGFQYKVYQQEASSVSERFRSMVISIPRTAYPVAQIEIHLNSHTDKGYAQIDAVGIMDKADLKDVRSALSGANFNVQQVMTFTTGKELLSKAINSKYIEAKPLVSHDGKSLYFSRLFHPDNVGGRLDPQDIYLSKFTDGQWNHAENLDFPLNDEFANGVCSITPDGRHLLVINHYRKDGSILPGVSISRKGNSGWEDPEGIEIVGFENTSEFQDFYLSADQKILLMAVERKSGYGDQDLYVSEQIGYNQYSAPRNLGHAINTRMAEFAPFLSLDNTTLYFASDGHRGYGQSDIYKSKRLDDSWQNWTEPENLGPSINTSSWDAYFSVTAAGDYAYFVSSEGAKKGTENIFRIPLLQGMDQSSEGQFALNGMVLDASTMEPIEAEISIKDELGHMLSKLTSDRLRGDFSIDLKQQNIAIHTSAVGYIPNVVHAHLSMEGSSQGSRRTILLEPISKNQVLSLDNLLFEKSKPVLLEHSFTELQKLISILEKNPSLKIQLAGHTDALGSRKSKEMLSNQRVETIKQHLVELGIERNRIKTVGFGGSRPIAPNDNEENRAKNRRVEVKILEI